MTELTTQLIRNQIKRSEFNEHSAPLYLTSSYVFEDPEDMRAQFSDEKEGLIYSRYGNPNVNEFIDRMALLEGAENGWATATGMSAVFTLFGALLSAGDHVVSCRSIFGSTHKLLTEILPKWNIQSSYVNFDDYEGYENAINENTKIVYIETPSNPGLDIIDIRRLAETCKRKDVLLVVDNCFATPLLQQPITLGADVTIHSSTKYIDGQGRTLGGVILASNTIIDEVRNFARHTGPALSPFNAWVQSKSLETLDVRMERHCNSAFEIAKRLQESSAIAQVKYPLLPTHQQYEIVKRQMSAGGGIISFELKSGVIGGQRFLDRLQLFSLTANLGDVKSIATHPASTTHSKLTPEQRLEVGITDGLIRLSIGLENVDDLWNDIHQAL